MRNEALMTFLAIHRSGTVSRASEILHRSQPAVSRRLKAFEAELGVILFDRTPSGLQLTTAGEVLLPYAEIAAAAEVDGIAAVRDHAQRPIGPLSMTIVGSLAGSWLADALAGFRRTHDRVELVLATANSTEIHEQIVRGEISIGVCRPLPGFQVSTELLFHEDLIVVCNPDHHLCGRTVDGLGDLAGETWLAFPSPRDATPSDDTARARLIDHGVPPEGIRSVDSLTSQKRLAEAGFGLVLIPASGTGEELRAGRLGAIGLRATPTGSPVVLVTRKKGYLSRAARSLIDTLRSRASGDGETSS